jgi:penicillin amidase
MIWLRRALYVLLLLVLSALAALWIYAELALPRTDGVVTLAGPRAEVRIERDARGIPTIRAATLEDAMFGLGFAHAQDRLWQLETHRRIAAGRLSEAFGAGALDSDRFLRALGVRRAAAAQWANVRGRTRSTMLAYADGINAYLRSEMKARPPEFVMLGVHPEPWDPVDSVGWAIMMCYDLGANWSTELLRLRLALKMPVARINELLPPYPGEQPLQTADYAALLGDWRVAGGLDLQRMAAMQSAAPPSGIEGIGSNNWVVHGTRTQSGKPLLANDPHLKLSAPALWYFARIETPELRIAGATMPGLPGVVLGQSEHVAWGFTNTAPDVQDLYLERIKPGDPSQYQTPDGWAKFETFSETIRVKGQADVTMTARRTRHGPVISDGGGVADGLQSLDANGGADMRPTYAIAMRWTALDAESGTLDAGLGFNLARSVDEFIAASASYVAPMQNMVVADRDGHIAFVAAGRVPLRKPDNDLKGLVPAPGWDARYDWASFLEPTRTPREMNPQRGWIATANQRIHATDYPHFLTSEWALPYRQQRIEVLLQATPKHTLDTLAAMHGDVLSLAAQRLLPTLRKARSSHALAPAVEQELARFDGMMRADKAAPLIFWAWTRQLTHGVFADEIGEPLFTRTYGGRSFRDALEAVLERNDTWWCDDKSTPAAETCAQQADAALTRAIDELAARFGRDVSAWQWGAAHAARAEHRPFSRVKPLARWFELRTPVGGDTYTVNVSRVGLRPDATTGELYLDEHGPSLRALYDLGDPSKSLVMHSSGQSGIVLSRSYRDFVQRWANVEYVPLWSSTPQRTLVLQPAR